MSYVSTMAKTYTLQKKMGHKCMPIIRKNYTNFSGTTVLPLTKEQYNKGMALAHKMKNMSAW